MPIKIKALLSTAAEGQKVIVQGWVRTFRANRFIALNDGSTLGNLQCVVDFENFDESILKNISTGAALRITGNFVESQGKGQRTEIQVEDIHVYGVADPDTYPIQPKKHSFEFLREKAHLRVRTATFSAVMRIRAALSFGVHQFFQGEGFHYVNTPIITGSDAEGAGEMFRVSALDPKNPPLNEAGEVNYQEDFFGKETHLTVSGQLEAETYAMGLGEVYTFGPTFRAENSNTTRHLAEFWMIEPEIAFADLKDDMALAEDFLRFCIQFVLDNCMADLEFFDSKIEKGLIERLKRVAETSFAHYTYTDAVALLIEHVAAGKVKFDPEAEAKEPLEWGVDLRSEHERYLCEKVIDGPVIVTDYPASIKSFYMRLNDDEKTVQAMDILVPGVGEIIGGSVREERFDVLEQKIKDLGQNPEDYAFYLDLRKYGSVPHAGFGLGFERMVAYCTGMQNIRDVIPFPRWPGNCQN